MFPLPLIIPFKVKEKTSAEVKSGGESKAVNLAEANECQVSGQLTFQLTKPKQVGKISLKKSKSAFRVPDILIKWEQKR